MDTIAIHGLKVETLIGHHDWERQLPRTLLLDLELATDVARVAKTDALADALDYQAVADAAKAFVEESRVTLIETLAEQLAQKLLADFPTMRVKLTVHKPGAVPGTQSVNVTVERTRQK
jgi:7,8-dihydroneopterin aldolase/epimerase/oxygenase